MSIGIIEGVVIAICLIGCITDLKTRRIPNWLTFGAAASALAAHTITSGWSGSATAATGWIVGALLFMPFFLLRGMGAGDVKLLAAIGSWMGPKAALWIALYTSIAGGVLALCVAASTRYLPQMFRNLWLVGTHWRVMGPRAVPGLTLENTNAPRLAYAIPIFAGTVIALWLK
jgi:prepilin peptidase CpaA